MNSEDMNARGFENYINSINLSTFIVAKMGHVLYWAVGIYYIFTLNRF